MKNARAEAGIVDLSPDGKQQTFSPEAENGVVDPRRKFFKLRVSVRGISERTIGHNGRKNAVAQHVCPRGDTSDLPHIVDAETALDKASDACFENILQRNRFNGKPVGGHIRAHIRYTPPVFQIGDKLRRCGKSRIE